MCQIDMFFPPFSEQRNRSSTETFRYSTSFLPAPILFRIFRLRNSLISTQRYEYTRFAFYDVGENRSSKSADIFAMPVKFPFVYFSCASYVRGIFVFDVSVMSAKFSRNYGVKRGNPCNATPGMGEYCVKDTLDTRTLTKGRRPGAGRRVDKVIDIMVATLLCHVRTTSLPCMQNV